jgi:hypothetical protein
MAEIVVEFLVYTFLELIPEVIRIVTKSIGVIFIKVFTFTTTPVKNLYHDESKTVQSYVVGAFVIAILIIGLIYYFNI